MHYNGQWGAGPMVLRPMRSGGVIPESFRDVNMGLADLGLTVGNGYDGEIHWNLEWEDLYAAAIRRKEGEMTAHGVLRTVTGERTGRSPNDRYIVKLHESKISSIGKGLTSEDVWWGDVNTPISENTFNLLQHAVTDHLLEKDEWFIQNLYCGADPEERLNVMLITENAWHASFARNMFIRPSVEEIQAMDVWAGFTILHAPSYQARPDWIGSKGGVTELNSEAFVIINFENRMVIIGGTQYAGEIKKSIFSIMNHILPSRGHLPMHCSSNTTGENTAVFFGLSGTGKTTLSADPNRALVGDDEHGWSAKGVFNFEGGCYAKLIDLSEEDEPAIFATTKMPGSILENIIVDDDGIPDFTDDTLTANTRGSYPIEFIENRTPDSMAGHPQNVVFLTCDAFGVLPPISRLSPAQAAYHFISGYTAKVAGTEIGVKEPQATFSACFGAPFMPRHPSVYADLLAEKMAQHDAKCWLLNTGWVSGGYGKSKRIRIKWTRALLNAALDGSLNDVEFVIDPRFGFEIPQSCAGVDEEILNPRDTWGDGSEYDAAANRLAEMFGENFAQFAEGTSAEVLAAAPKPLE